MPKSKSPSVSMPSELPGDLAPASILKARYAFAAILADCTTTHLDEKGRSWGGNQHVREKLYSEKEYVETGLRLCEDLPGVQSTQSDCQRNYRPRGADRQLELFHEPIERSGALGSRGSK